MGSSGDSERTLRTTRTTGTSGSARFRLYLVTDRRNTGGRPLLDVIRAALRGGVEAVQLREKDLSARALYELGVQLRELCAEYGARLLINDRVDLALAVNADGVHLPVDSFSIADARALLGPDKLVGASTHSLAQATAAQNAGADFVVFGPVFDTPSKRGFGAPVGLTALREVTERMRIPVLAIGGISVERVGDVCAQGAAGVAVVSAILEAEDPAAAAGGIVAQLPV